MTKSLQSKKDKAPKAGVTYIIVPPDGGWGWVIVAASFVCNFVAEGTMYSYGLFLPDIAEGLNTTITNVSLANSLMTGFYFFFGPIICALINKYGYRIIGFSGGILATIAFAASSWAPDIAVLILTYGLVGGVGFGMLYMPSVIAIGFYFEAWRGVANSVSLCGSAVGSITIPIIIGVSMKSLDWRRKFLGFTGFAFFCALCTLLYKPLRPLEVPIEETKETKKPKYDLEIDDDDELYQQTMLNRYRRASNPPKAGSFMSIRRVGSPTGMSGQSFKSYASVFRGSRMMANEGCCDTCCNCDNFKNTCWTLMCCCKRRHAPARPMYRDDILYTGSVAFLPEYNNPEFVDTLDFHMSVTRMPDVKELDEEEKCCVCCPIAIRRPLVMMLHLGMFKSAAFSLVAVSGFLTMLGFYIPLTYLTQKCIKQGMDKEVATYLLSAFGFAHLVGRISCAIINFFPSIKALPTSTLFIFTAGSAVIVSVFVPHEYVQFGFSATYGFSFAMILSLRPILVVELFGLEKLSNSFGIMMMLYGMGCLLGIPIAGLLYNFTSDYTIPFLFGGGAILLSGFLMAIVKPISNREKRRAARRRRKAHQQKHATTSKDTGKR